MRDIAIFGAGGFGRETALMITQINSLNPTWNLLGFYDDEPSYRGQMRDLSVLGGMDALNGYDRKLDLVIAVADPSIRFRIKNRIRNSNISFPVIVHPSAMMGDVLVPSIGEGSVICAGCIFTTDIVIEAFSIINLGCTVGHDVKIQKFCSIMPGCSLSGNVTLECGVLVGTGAKILPGLTIGKWSTVGAGAVVTKDISEGITVVGVPARRLN